MIWASALTGPSGSALQVLPAELLGLGEPVVLDRLVEEGRVGLVAVVGLGILPQVLGQLADEGPVVLGLDLGDAGSRRARPPRQRQRSPSPITTSTTQEVLWSFMAFGLLSQDIWVVSLDVSRSRRLMR